MIENGFVYAVNKSLEKERKAEERKLSRKEKAHNTIVKLQNKYDFSFGYMTKEDANKMTDKEKERYYKAIKLTTTYSDEVLSRLGLC